jgi:glyoxylase-like metal-dependent hydrolase (beta-lactamase superfamily II)
VRCRFFLIAFVACNSAPEKLPVPSASLGALPVAHPPPDMSIALLMTGATHSPASMTFRGGSGKDERRLVMTATLVHHAKGDLLIDAGFSHDVLPHIPKLIQLAGRPEIGVCAAEQLRAAGYDFAQLRGVIPTHVHWDHIAGLSEMPAVPVWLNAAEEQFVSDGGKDSALMRSYNAKIERYDFSDGAYLGFARSHDVWGDGSVVVVEAPGHTPGSVIVFVTLPSAKRYAFIGDLAWQREGVFLPAEKPWPMRGLVDRDPEAVRAGLEHMAQIHAQFPEIDIVPAHDEKASAELPLFPKHGS